MRYIIGIDEVGRACLAGPVTVTALAIPEDFDSRIFDFDLGLASREIDTKPKQANSKPVLRDSKKLTQKQREEWVERLKLVSEIKFITKSVKPKIIDEINIANAANLAAYKAVGSLVKSYNLALEDCSIYLDGGLYIKGRRYQEKNFISASTVIKADELIPAVSLASIVAKVHRDSHMRRLSRVYPQYGFHLHKGYPTRLHRDAIIQHGGTEFHRNSFLGKILAGI